MPQNLRKILFPTVFVLFVLEVLTLPLVLGLTYASKSESPEHILTFSDRRLVWDADTDVDADGTAKLSLFEQNYTNVQADDAAQVIAPGTQGGSLVRLNNQDEKAVRYTAVAYAIDPDEQIPVAVTLSGENSTAASEYALPDGISVKAVVSAVTGQVGSGQIQDFSINWIWQYEEDAVQDASDTMLGDKAAYAVPDDLTIGIYITVEDENGDVIVSSPQTGYDAVIGGYAVLFCISAAMLVFLTVTRKKEEINEE